MTFVEDEYRDIQVILDYPKRLNEYLNFFEDTSSVEIPKDSIERVIFQQKAKESIRKIAQNRGNLLLVGKPGTGKSFLADMFEKVIDDSIGEYIRPQNSILAIPGKDKNHIRFVYLSPEKADTLISDMLKRIDDANKQAEELTLDQEIRSMNRGKKYLLGAALFSLIIGLFFAPAFIVTGLLGMGSIFLHMQEVQFRVQEKIQQDQGTKKSIDLKRVMDMVPEVMFDPRKEERLMARVSEPEARNMKGGFRHDPYQSGRLETPAHKRAYLGAHARSPIIYIDELKSLIKRGYMSELLEIMQNKRYFLEGGSGQGSGSADRSDNEVMAENILIACCNHDTYAYLRDEGDGAFLSRIEDSGQVIEMENAVEETQESVRETIQYIKQETESLDRKLKEAWKDVVETEGYEGVRIRNEKILGKNLPENYLLKVREFSRNAAKEVVKELRARSGNRKLSAILRPINGIIKEAQLEAIFENSPYVEPRHVREAVRKHVSLEGAMTEEYVQVRKELKKYLDTIIDSIGYVIGLAVFESRYSGQMYGTPLPIHCQINVGGPDKIIATGKLGEIAREAAENVRASIRKVFEKTQSLYTGYEMHIQYIQAHGGVEGDSASLAMAIGLISDYIRVPVNQKYGVTGSLTGDVVLAVGGVTEKVRSIMDTDLGMEGACIPWQNRYDVEPLLVNMESEYIQKGDVPGVRIYRELDRTMPFDIYFCKTKYNACEIIMYLGKEAIEQKMADRSLQDFELAQKWQRKLHESRQGGESKMALV
jgi:Lon-like ATP-dependent protease